MPQYSLDERIETLTLILSKLRPGQHVDVKLNHCVWWITIRPGYCDRGRYQWFCESKDHREFSLDGADGFPRYFFSLEAMTIEMKLWCEARSRQIEGMEFPLDHPNIPRDKVEPLSPNPRPPV